ncbi:MAG: lactonase family protein [Bacteroidales bacterium]|nr:lactonase family protein [Bacteroidales bacterium]
MQNLFTHFLIVLLAIGCRTGHRPAVKEIIYVGTFDERGSQGIYVFDFIRDSVSFRLLQTVPNQKSPSFLEIHPSGRFLYAVNRSSVIDGKEWGTLSAFSIDQNTGMIVFINEQSTYGRGPCHISFSRSGNHAFVSNYNDGSLVVYGVNDDGSAGDSLQLIRHHGKSINALRQESPHVHSAIMSPDDRFLYVSDLGIDKVMIYEFNPGSGLLRSASTPYYEVRPGSGPRHFTIHPNGRFAYLAEELSSTTSVFKRDTALGTLTRIQRISSIPSDYNEQNTNADIHTDPEGRFLYVSNRGHNSLAIYTISEDGMLSVAGYRHTMGDRPRNFLIDHNGDYLFVANRDSDHIRIFKISRQTGIPDDTGTVVEVPGAVCIKMLRLR